MWFRKRTKPTLREELEMAIDPVREAMHMMADAVTRLSVAVDGVSDSVNYMSEGVKELNNRLDAIEKRLDDAREAEKV